MKNIYKSLAEFQQEVPVIHKGTAGFNYSYADLPAILDIINPLLKKHGLGFFQGVDREVVGERIITTLRTVVFHIDTGEHIESITPVPLDVDLGKMNKYQVMGSGITYIRRYALSSLLGLVTDKDTDAASTTTKSNSSNEPF